VRNTQGKGAKGGGERRRKGKRVESKVEWLFDWQGFSGLHRRSEKVRIEKIASLLERGEGGTDNQFDVSECGQGGTNGIHS